MKRGLLRSAIRRRGENPFISSMIQQHAYHEKKSANENGSSRYKMAMAAAFLSAIIYQFLNEKHRISHLISTASNAQIPFEYVQQLVEFYLTETQLSVFSENRDPKTGERRMFFMGESAEQARETLINGKAPITTANGHLTLPQVIDKTLHSDTANLPGTCLGLTGLTADLESTKEYEAVHLVVPSQSKILITSLHATSEDHNDKNQFATAGLRKEEIFATLYRDPKTKAFCRIELNENFTGDLAELELDSLYMPDIIALLPDEKIKAILRERINPNLHPNTLYESKLAPCATSHRAAVEARRLFKRNHDALDIMRGEEERDHVNVIHTEDNRVFYRYSEQGGGNPGGFFMGHDNEAYYIKYGLAHGQVLTDDEIEAGISETTDDPRRMNRTRFENEFLIGQLYRVFGIDVPKTHLIQFKKDGQWYIGIASKFIPDLRKYDTYKNKQGWRESAEFLVKLQIGGLLDFLFGNYDVIGLGFDNTLGRFNKLTKELDPIRIDPGAGLLFRAKGTPLDLDTTADDFLTESLTPGLWYEIYEGSFGCTFQDLIQQHNILYQAIRVVESVSPDQIAAVFNQHGYQDAALNKKMLETVLKRREALLTRAHQLLRKLFVENVQEQIAISSEQFKRSSGYEMASHPMTPIVIVRKKAPSLTDRVSSSLRRLSFRQPADRSSTTTSSLQYSFPSHSLHAIESARQTKYQQAELTRRETVRNLSIALTNSLKERPAVDLTSPTFGTHVESEVGSVQASPVDPKNQAAWDTVGFTEERQDLFASSESDESDIGQEPIDINAIMTIACEYNSARLFSPQIEAAIKTACEALRGKAPEPMGELDRDMQFLTFPLPK